MAVISGTVVEVIWMITTMRIEIIGIAIKRYDIFARIVPTAVALKNQYVLS